jgi:hypothetical protein
MEHQLDIKTNKRSLHIKKVVATEKKRQKDNLIRLKW